MTLRSERDTTPKPAPYLTFVHPLWRHVALGAGELTLGRSAQADVVLDSPSVSRRHARIRAHGACGARITNEATKNRTAVNGIAVDEAELRAGDILRLGDHVAIVRASTCPPGRFATACADLWATETVAECVAAALRVATSTIPMLIAGETGTGKELLARAVHQTSRPNKPFVAVNCAALTPSLIEAELFGHERGAFTGAVSRRDGFVRQANGGTLFLDEVAELDKEAQAKLLRVVQEGEVQPLGSPTAVRVDVRFVCATHQDLVPLVDEGQFRRDLYHRLVGCQVELPALRQRREDVLPLFRHFLGCSQTATARWSAWVAEALCLYDWPGNVRELRQVAHAMAAQHQAKTEWTKAELPSTIADAVRERDGAPSKHRSRPAAQELIRQLEAHGGNVQRTAKHFEVSRQTIYDWKKQLGLGLERR